MRDAWSMVDAEVRTVVRDRGIDPAVRRDEVRAIAEAVVAAYEERALVSSLPDLGEPSAVVQALLDSVAGFGPLQPYLDDPSVEEIWINEPSRVFVARDGRSELTSTMSPAYKTEERTIRNIIKHNVMPADPTKKLQLIIYYKSMKTSKLLIKNNEKPTPRHLQQSHVIYEHTIAIENCGPQKYIGMTQTTCQDDSHITYKTEQSNNTV